MPSKPKNITELSVDKKTLREVLITAADEYKGDNWPEEYARIAERLLGGEMDKEDFASRLKAAKQAHGEYEQQTGEPDEDWAGWYAEYILGNTK